VTEQRRGVPSCAAHSSGLGLVELMVAVTIGTFVIGAGMAAWLAASSARRALDSAARLQEIARYALSVIEPDLRMAGYWGLTNRADAIGASTVLAFPPRCGGAAWVTDVAHVVDGTNDGYLPYPSCAALSGGARPGTDVLIVRRASARRITPQRPVITAVDQDRVLVVTNHAGGEIFVPQDDGNRLPAGYATSDPPGEAPQADTRALLVHAYYVSAGSSSGAGYPALRRKTLVAGPDVSDEEVVAGVEDLQFQLGLDTDGDGSADLIADPGSVPADAVPVAVRLWLLVVSPEGDAAFATQRIGPYASRPGSSFGDARLRLLISRTVRLRDTRQ
jgi:type IV pilus assembly protein PilW